MSERSSGSIHERWRNSTSGTSGSSRARTRASSSFASFDLTKRGWYCISTPRSFPESSSGSTELRNAANAASVGSPSWKVIAAPALTWKVNSSGVRSAQRRVTSGSGRA